MLAMHSCTVEQNSAGLTFSLTMCCVNLNFGAIPALFRSYCHCSFSVKKVRPDDFLLRSAMHACSKKNRIYQLISFSERSSSVISTIFLKENSRFCSFSPLSLDLHTFAPYILSFLPCRYCSFAKIKAVGKRISC